MKFLIKVSLYLQVLSIIIWDSNANEQPHPLGHGENIVRVIRKGNLAEFQGNSALIKEIFLHPKVKDRKIVVLSIIGAYRQGKSFFLDYCLRFLYANYGSVKTTVEKIPVHDWMGDADEPLTGFSWKHGSTAHTKGLVIWEDVFLYNAPNGEKIAIILIDTQGLFEAFSPEEENAKIFSFSTLISSIQIINIKEVIQENQIAHLQTAIELTKLTQNSFTQKPKWKLFQKLLFLMRDFEDEEFPHGFDGGKNYLKQFFTKQSNESTTASLNRDSIAESFSDISCFLLNHPGPNIRKKINVGQWGILDVDFVDNLKIVIESLLTPRNLIKKTVFGQEIKAAEYNDILDGYLNAYRSYAMPEVKSILQVAIDSQMISIVDEEVKKFKTALESERVSFHRVDFVQWIQQKLQAAKISAINNFNKADKIDDEPSKEKFRKILNNKIEETFKSWEKSTMHAYNEFKIEKEIQAIVSEKLTEYRKELNENVNFDVENFEASIDKKHNKVKASKISQFIEKTLIYNDISRTMRFKSILNKEIDQFYVSWKVEKLKEYQKNFIIKTRLLISKLAETFDEEMKKNLNPDFVHFKTLLAEKYQKEKSKIVQEFLKDRGQERKKYENELTNKIESKFATIKNEKIKEHQNVVDSSKELAKMSSFDSEAAAISSTVISKVSDVIQRDATVQLLKKLGPALKYADAVVFMLEILGIINDNTSQKLDEILKKLEQLDVIEGKLDRLTQNIYRMYSLIKNEHDRTHALIKIERIVPIFVDMETEENKLSTIILSYPDKRELLVELDRFIRHYRSENYPQKLLKNLFIKFTGYDSILEENIAIGRKYSSGDLSPRNLRTSTQKATYDLSMIVLTKIIRGFNVLKLAVGLKLAISEIGTYSDLNFIENLRIQTLDEFQREFGSILRTLNDKTDLESYINFGNVPSNPVRFKNIFQTFFDTEPELSGSDSCKKSCSHWSGRNHNRIGCEGTVHNCGKTYNTRLFWSNDPDRIYHYYKYNGNSYDMKLKESTRRNRFGFIRVHRCSVCKCDCDQKFKSSTVRKIFTEKISAPTGYVVTGVRFAEKAQTIYLQIQVGMLLPMGFIKPESIYWMAPPSSLYPYSTITYGNGDSYTIHMDPQTRRFGGKQVVTGLQFKYDSGIYLEVFGKSFNFEQGILFENENGLSQIASGHYTSGNKVGLESSGTNFYVNRDSKVTFTKSEDSSDAGQSFVPYFDSSDVTFDQPAPLSMIGLVHYTNDGGYAGYVRPVIKSLNYRDYI